MRIIFLILRPQKSFFVGFFRSIFKQLWSGILVSHLSNEQCKCIVEVQFIYILVLIAYKIFLTSFIWKYVILNTWNIFCLVFRCTFSTVFWNFGNIIEILCCNSSRCFFRHFPFFLDYLNKARIPVSSKFLLLSECFS